MVIHPDSGHGRDGHRVRAPRGGRRDAFTLPEVLTVIGILAVLLALLLPAIVRARDAGRKAVCASNLRQLGAAFLQYGMDHDDRLPLPGSADQYDMDQAGPYWDMADDSPGGGLNAYVKARSSGARPGPSIWYCPEMPDYHETDIIPDGSTVSFRQVTQRSYVMNWYLRDPAPDARGGSADIEEACANPDPAAAVRLFACAGRFRAPLTLSRVVAPADTVLLFEGPPVEGSAGAEGTYLGPARRSGDFSFQKGYLPTRRAPIDVYRAQGIATNAWDAARPWHGLVNHYLFCDGHLAAMPARSYPWVPTPSDNHWYPTRYR